MDSAASSTTAKVTHPWNFFHDETGYNYRMTNLNAAVGCAQMECIDDFLQNKRELARLYLAFFQKTNIRFFSEPENCRSNYWLNLLLFENETERNTFLKITNEHGVMTRPFWTMMNKLPMYKTCYSGNLENANRLEATGVNIPSGVRKNLLS